MIPANPIPGLAALLLAAGPFLARPAESAIGDTRRPSALPWSDVVQVASFDPALGSLSAVRLTIDAFARVELRAENLGAVPQMVDVCALAQVSVQLPGGRPAAYVPFDGHATWQLEAFDGSADFAGASGNSAVTAGRRSVEVLIDDPSVLVQFVGAPGGAGMVTLPVAAVGSTSVLGNRPVVGSAALDAGVRVRVQYLLDAGD